MNLKNLNRSTKSNVITFGIVIGFYLLIQILSAAGMVTTPSRVSWCLSAHMLSWLSP